MLSLSPSKAVPPITLPKKTTTLSASWSQSGLAGGRATGTQWIHRGATLDAMAQGKLPDGTELSRIVNGKRPTAPAMI